MSGEEDQLEEIDFTEIGRLQAEVDAAAADAVDTTAQVETLRETFTGFYVDTKPATVKHPVAAEEQREVLGDDDDEIIVYVAPHPRAGPVTPPNEKMDVTSVPTASIPTGRPMREAVTNAIEIEARNEMTSELTTPNGSSVHGSPQPKANSSAPVDIREQSATTRLVSSTNEVEGVSSDQATRSDATELQENTYELPKEAPGAQGDSHEPPADASEVCVDTVEAQAERPSTPAAVADVSFSFRSTTSKLTRRFHPTRTPRSLIKTRLRRKPLRGSFGTFGARLEEEHLHEVDPRESERRRGDSDLDWGDGSDTKDAVDELSTGVGDMQIDDDLDVNAMASFVQSMSAEGSRQVTMDDIADTQLMADEDDSVDGSEEDAELERTFRQEEDEMVAEVGEDSDDDDDAFSSDDGETPRRAFTARLQRIRENAQGKRPARAEDFQDDSSDDYDMELDQSWGDQDDEFIAHMQVSAG